MIAVFPTPGAPVMMNLLIRFPFQGICSESRLTLTRGFLHCISESGHQSRPGTRVAVLAADRRFVPRFDFAAAASARLDSHVAYETCEMTPALRTESGETMILCHYYGSFL